MLYKVSLNLNFVLYKFFTAVVPRSRLSLTSLLHLVLRSCIGTTLYILSYIYALHKILFSNVCLLFWFVVRIRACLLRLGWSHLHALRINLYCDKRWIFSRLIFLYYDNYLMIVIVCVIIYDASDDIPWY